MLLHGPSTPDEYCDPSDPRCDVFADQADTTDILDIDSAAGSRIKRHPWEIGSANLNGDKPAPKLEPLVEFTGKDDDANWFSEASSAEDDAGLGIKFKDTTRLIFLQDAINLMQGRERGLILGPPTGTHWGGAT